MLHFYKFQGAGNDFILIDNRVQNCQLNTQQIAFLCHRRWGIGADGLMLLERAEGYNFRMVYYNADGQESTMCGNGGRCITAFARHLNLVDEHAYFIAIDGAHEASYTTDNNIKLQMNDVCEIEHHENYAILNTGSPHYVSWQNEIEQLDVFKLGRQIRNEERFMPKGINVNFAKKMNDELFVRTYERGVEEETLSCGTGVTAAAIASTGNAIGNFEIKINTPGGQLIVTFTKESPNSAKEVFLIGPAQFVFEGSIQL